ncbi:MAG: hypothetical protein QXD61_06275 [Candidatus Caldarchaeum sp.]
MTKKIFQTRLYRAGAKPFAGLKLRIPSLIVEKLRLRHGQTVEVSLQGNVIKVKVKRRQKHTKTVTPRNDDSASGAPIR